MKKLSKLVALATALIVATFVGCSDIADEGLATSGYTDAKSSLTQKTLTINVTSQADVIKFKVPSDTNSSREIAPATIDSEDVKFFLFATNVETEATLPVEKVTFVGTDSSTTTGTVTVEIDAANYRFVLAAVPTDKDDPTTLSGAIGVAQLIGYADADLRYTEEAASVNFVLTPDGLTGNGYLWLKLYLDNWSERSLGLDTTIGEKTGKMIDMVTLGLYDIDTGDVVTSSKVPSGDSAYFSFVGATSEATAKSYNGTSANGTEVSAIAPGTYDFTVTFTYAGKPYIYSDKVMILANRTTEQFVPIPDVMVKPPLPPENLTVGYIPPETSDSGYYKAVFNWEDKSNNELYFELDLYDISTDETNHSASTANVLAKWPSSLDYDGKILATYSNGSENPTDSGHKSKVFYGLKQDSGPNWYAGSLNRNNTEAVFYLPLGKRYLARIQAVSSSGDSGYAVTEVDAGSYAVAAVGTGYSEDGTTEIANSANLAHKAYCTPAATKYTIDSGKSTATTANLGTGGESRTATKFNTEIIGLFRVTYELVGGAFSPDNSSVYYFDQLVDGNPIVQPDGVRIVKLAKGIVNSNELVYNGTKTGSIVNNAALSLTYGPRSAPKKWTSWRRGNINGTKYPSSYTECDSSSTFNKNEAYYKLVGSDYGLTVLTEQPADWPTGYYTATLSPYDGYENLVLYANYTSNTFGVTIKDAADYLLENNISITASLIGTNNAAGDKPKIRTSANSVLGKETVDVLKTKLGGNLTKTIATNEMAKAGDGTYKKDSASTALSAADWNDLKVGDIVWESGVPVTVTSLMLAAGQGRCYVDEEGTKPAVWTGTDQNITSTATVYIQSDEDEPVVTVNPYLILDRTYYPVTYSNPYSLTVEDIAAAKGELYTDKYIPATLEWWQEKDDATPPAYIRVTTDKVFSDSDGLSPVVTLDTDFIKVVTNQYFYDTYTNTTATFWSGSTPGTTVIYTDASGEEKSKIKVTEAMLLAVSGKLYTTNTTGATAMDAAYWSSSSNNPSPDTDVYYSNDSGSTFSGPVTLTAEMIKAGKNQYYTLGRQNTTNTILLAAKVGDIVYKNSDITDTSEGNKVSITEDMIKAINGDLYRKDGYIQTTAAFWKKATTSSTVYSYTAPSTYDEVPMTQAMIDAANGKYFAKNDGSDEAVNWESATVGLNVYSKTLGEAVKTSSLVLNYKYNNTDDNGIENYVTYEKVEVEVLKQGSAQGTSVATYPVTGGTQLTISLSGFTNGSYIIRYKGYVPSSNVKAPYEFNTYLQIND